MTPAAEFRANLRGTVPLAVEVGVYGLAFGVLASRVAPGVGEVGAIGSLVFAASPWPWRSASGRCIRCASCETRSG